MPTRRTLCRASLAGVAVSAAAVLAVPAATAAPRGTDPSISVTPAHQTVQSGSSASWHVTASGSSVTVTFGDGKSTTHAAGTFTLPHKFAECTAHAKTDTQKFSVANSSGSRSVKTTVLITYSGPLCS